MIRKEIIRLAGLALSIAIFAGASSVVFAQSYPSKPIRFIVPYPPGGLTDVVARTIAQKLTESWGQPVVIDNRGGAGGVIGTEMAAKAIPDGYTILMAGLPFAVSACVYSKLPYDPIKDFAPVTLVASTPLVLVVHPSLPAKSVKELIALAKSKPGQLNYASSGNGTGTHLSGELLKTMADIKMVHSPYKGGAPGVTALLGGEVQLMFTGLSSAMPHVKAGKLRALGVTTAKRSAAEPDLPTLAEAGLPGFEVDQWLGVLAPAKTPREIVTKFNVEIAKILHMPEVKSRYQKQGIDAVGSSPEQFASYVKAEIAKWAQVVKDSGTRVD